MLTYLVLTKPCACTLFLCRMQLISGQWLDKHAMFVTKVSKGRKCLLVPRACCLVGNRLVEMFTQRKLPFRIELKYILFLKPAFHQLINSWSENTTVSMWGKLIAAEQQKMVQFLPGSLLKLPIHDFHKQNNLFHLYRHDANIGINIILASFKFSNNCEFFKIFFQSVFDLQMLCE